MIKAATHGPSGWALQTGRPDGCSNTCAVWMGPPDRPSRRLQQHMHRLDGPSCRDVTEPVLMAVRSGAEKRRPSRLWLVCRGL